MKKQLTRAFLTLNRASYLPQRRQQKQQQPQLVPMAAVVLGKRSRKVLDDEGKPCIDERIESVTDQASQTSHYRFRQPREERDVQHH